MKVEIHDLKHEKWFLEAEPSNTIGELKKKNAEERSLDDSSNQKLIYSGKILKDADTLESITYAEGKGFIVCMVSKSKKQAAKPATPAAPPAATAAAVPKVEGASDARPQPPHASASSETAAPLTGPSALATGSQLSTIVSNIMDMGYPQHQVVRALRQAYNNPDRAVEYLVTGQVPDEPEAQQGEEEQELATDASGNSGEAASEAVQGSEPSTHEGRRDQSTIDRNLFEAAEEREMDEEGEVVAEDDIDFHELLGLDDDQLNELRASVRQNPQELLRLLDPLVRNNPQVAETLINNLDRFMWFLDNTGEPGEMSEIGEEGDAPGQRSISITPEEEEAIHRLMELGFEFDVVALAYLACEKNEQLAANYLLEHGNDV